MGNNYFRPREHADGYITIASCQAVDRRRHERQLHTAKLGGDGMCGKGQVRGLSESEYQVLNGCTEISGFVRRVRARLSSPKVSLAALMK